MQIVEVALVEHLLTVAAITTLVSTRIYGGELEEDEVANMPQQVVIIRGSGGLEAFRTHTIQRPRFDILSYGDGYLEALQVDHAVADALRAIRRVDVNSTLLHSAGYGQPFQLKEPETGWRFILRTATVVAGECATV